MFVSSLTLIYIREQSCINNRIRSEEMVAPVEGEAMKTRLHCTPVLTFAAFGFLAWWVTSVIAMGIDHELTPATQRELAAARAATAKYHDLAQAEADGYVNIDLYLPEEGFHWVNASLIDGDFDPAHPEVLLYAPVPGEKRLQLVAVEYLVPLVSATPPAGFTGTADRWRQDDEGFGLWELNAWIWEHNPNGLFTFLNPRIP